MRNDEALLRTAIEKLRETEPDAAQVNSASRRVADRLGIDLAHYPDIEAIESCGDVRQLLTAYRGGNLSDARRLVIHAHLRDCSACQHYYRGGSESAVDWSSPKAALRFAWRPRAMGWALAPAFALLVIGFFFYRAILAGSAWSSSRGAVDRWRCLSHLRCRRSSTICWRQAAGG